MVVVVNRQYHNVQINSNLNTLVVQFRIGARFCERILCFVWNAITEFLGNIYSDIWCVFCHV